MESLVGLKRHLLAEGLAAEAADEGLLSGVDPTVGIQVAHLPEGLATHQAGEGLLPSVDPAVDLQVLAHRKTLAAHLTGEATASSTALVATQVPPQDALLPEGPPTELADEGRRSCRDCQWCCSWVVDLSVALQQAAAAEGLVAGGAGEGGFVLSFFISSSCHSPTSWSLLIGLSHICLLNLLLFWDLLSFSPANDSFWLEVLPLQLLLFSTRG